MPIIETDFATPIFFVAKVAVAPLWSSVTTSSVSIPSNAAVPLASSEVALVVAS